MDTIKRNSWHFRLYEGYSNGEVWALQEGSVNFCQYWRKVVQGFLGACGITLLLAWFASGVLQLVGTIGLWLLTDNELQPFIGAFPIIQGQGALLDYIGLAAWVAVAVMGCILIVGGVCYAADEYSFWKRIRADRQSKLPPKELGFFRTWYRSWKDKYCPIVKLEEK